MSNAKSVQNFSFVHGIGRLVMPLAVAALATACSEAQTGQELAGAEAREAQAEDHLGEASEALIVQDIPCGGDRNYATYIGSRWTHARATSSDSTKRILLSYQVGFHSGTNLEFTELVDFGGYWWGAVLYVSYVGFYEGDEWKGCDGAPGVRVQTW